MTGGKTCWVNDTLYGSIEISLLEKRLISTTIFNRLHNILQNSTVYLTYPSNRTSRFNHSLGCMHVAGEIFRHSILNASQTDRNNLLKLIDEEIRKSDSTDLIITDTKRFIRGGSQSELQKLSCQELVDQHYRSKVPHGLSDEDSYKFILVFQALRFAAVLHDVGHPPFSHVTENALGEVFDILCGRPVRSKAEETFFKNYEKGQSLGIPFHEWLSKKLTETLLDNVLDTLVTDKLKYDLIRIKDLAIGILSDRSPLHNSLHRIIDSDLDADRLDYVLRDLVMSGVSRESSGFERLIASYQLVFADSSNSRALKPCFLPSVRALSTIEDFFQKRFQLYRFVIYHHRVVKFDALLQKCVVALADQFFSRHSDLEGRDDYLLNDNISGLWQVLESSVEAFNSKRISYYIQWDDIWLLTILRREYFTLLKNQGGGTAKSIIQIQLEELLSNSKAYFSLFKKGDTFQETDVAFLKALPKNFDWGQLKRRIRKYPSLKPNLASLVEYFNIFKKTRSKKSKELISCVEKHGFFLVALLNFLHSAGLGGKYGMEFVRAATKVFQKNAELTDVIVITKKIKPGVNNELQLINRNGEIIHLGQVSRVADALLQSALFFPPFFTFIYRNRGLENHDFSSLRTRFGKQLGTEFIRWIKNI